MLRKLLIVLTAATAVSCGESPTQPPPSLIGGWIGTASGVRVEIHVVEHAKTQTEYGPRETISGTGTLTDLKDGRTIPINAQGFVSNVDSRIQIAFGNPDFGPTAFGYGFFVGVWKRGTLAGGVEADWYGVGPWQRYSRPEDNPMTLVPL